jgi:hypothetical protein
VAYCVIDAARPKSRCSRCEHQKKLCTRVGHDAGGSIDVFAWVDRERAAARTVPRRRQGKAKTNEKATGSSRKVKRKASSGLGDRATLSPASSSSPSPSASDIPLTPGALAIAPGLAWARTRDIKRLEDTALSVSVGLAETAQSLNSVSDQFASLRMEVDERSNRRVHFAEEVLQRVLQSKKTSRDELDACVDIAEVTLGRLK